MSKNTSLDRKLALTALVISIIGGVGYFVALFQAYSLVGRADNGVSTYNDLYVIVLAQKACTALIVCGIVLAAIVLVKRLFFRS